MKFLLQLFFILLFLPFISAQGFSEIGTALNLPTSYGFGEYGGGVSFVDFNQDGLDDLTYASGENDSLYFFMNTGSGFEKINSLVDDISEVKQVLWVDYDNDGDFDLYCTSHSFNKLYKNTGDLNFIDITGSTGFTDPLDQSFNGVWLDYDEDSLLDLCVSHRTGFLEGYIKLYKNLGNDEFQDVTAIAGLSDLGNSVLAMTTFDMNNDGWEDIYVGQDYLAGNLMLKNNGDGTFSNISASSNSAIENNTMSTTIGDYNNDGWMDIYITNTAEGNTLLKNQGDETFLELAAPLGVDLYEFTWGAIFIDADNDMDLDLHISSPLLNFVFENPGDGSPFTFVANAWGLGNDFNYSVGNALGDYNQDGRVDFTENNRSSQHSFWENNFTDNNYIAICLEGTESNSMGIGAVIDIFAGGIHQIRRVGCGEGFSSQNSNTQYFGLGTNSTIDSILIKWPNGLGNILTDVAANQKINVVEYDPNIISGCMDSLSCNYNPLANVDDGTCFYAQLFYDCSGNCLSDIDMDGVCDELEIFGCTDSIACNYDPTATENNNMCTYADLYHDCMGSCLNDIDGDGVCDELEIVGCMDSLACNFNPDATDDDGGCGYLNAFSISGKMSPEVFTPVFYTYSETMGSNYYWEVTGGEIGYGQGTTSLEVSWEVAGVGNISVTETNAIGCEITVTQEINILPVGLQRISEYQISIFPNPTNDFLIIDFGEWSEENVLIEIFDIYGKEILRKTTNRKIEHLDLKEISNGIYQLVLRNKDEWILEKIVIQ